MAKFYSNLISMEMKSKIYKRWIRFRAICQRSAVLKLLQNFEKIEKMVKNQPTIDAFMDRRWSSEYHFLPKLYNKLLHRPTNDVVNFRGRGWVECACIRWEWSRKGTHHESWCVRAISTFVKSPLVKKDDINYRHNIVHRCCKK